MSPRSRVAVPPIVHEVLRSPGEALEPGIRAAAEPKFGMDFSRVRTHTDARAAESARALGALGYSWGNHVVLGSKSDSAGPAARPVLAHELSHVAQFASTARQLPATVDAADGPNESAAHSAAHAMTAGHSHRVGRTPAVGLRLLRDSRLDRLVAGLADVARNAPLVLTDLGLVDVIMQHFQGVNLRDPDNMGPVSDAVARHFPEQTFFAFLRRVDSDVTAAEVSDEEQRMQRQLQMLRVPGRGVYGTRTPFPVTEMVTGTAARVGAHVSSVSSSFLGGIIEGMGGPGTSELVRRLSTQFGASTVVNVVAPQIFAAGAVVGIGQDLWRAITGLWEMITNFPEMMEKFRQLFNAFASPAAPGLARIMGRHFGQGWRADLERLAQHNIFRFTYELGRIVGPAIVYAVLTILGVTGVATMSAATAKLAQLLRQFPRLMVIIERIGSHLPRRRHTPQNVLVVGAERADEFAYAAEVAGRGHRVTVVNPRDPRGIAPAQAFTSRGGNYVQARVEDLAREPAFHLIREDFPVPMGRMFQPTREFADARLSRLRPGGRWVVVTEAPEFAETLSAAARRPGVTTTMREIPHLHEGAPQSPHPRERTRFLLIFEKSE